MKKNNDEQKKQPKNELPKFEGIRTEENFCIRCNKYVTWKNGKCPKGHKKDD